MQESVGGRQPGLTNHPREHRHRRRPLCRSRRRGQRGQGDHELYRAFGRDHGGEGEHERAPQEIADQEHCAPVVMIGDHAAHGPEQHVREQPADRRRPDPPGRSRGGVDVSQQSGVEEPVPELRRRAGPYERTGIVDGKNAAVRATGAHGRTLVVSHGRRKRFGRSAWRWPVAICTIPSKPMPSERRTRARPPRHAFWRRPGSRRRSTRAVDTTPPANRMMGLDYANALGEVSGGRAADYALEGPRGHPLRTCLHRLGLRQPACVLRVGRRQCHLRRRRTKARARCGGGPRADLRAQPEARGRSRICSLRAEQLVGKILEIHQELPGRIHVVLIRQSVGF